MQTSNGFTEVEQTQERHFGDPLNPVPLIETKVVRLDEPVFASPWKRWNALNKHNEFERVSSMFDIKIYFNANIVPTLEARQRHEVDLLGG